MTGEWISKSSDMQKQKNPSLPTLHDTAFRKLALQKKNPLEMRLIIVGMLLMPFCDNYSCVKQDLLHIAVRVHVIFQYQARDFCCIPKLHCFLKSLTVLTK